MRHLLAHDLFAAHTCRHLFEWPIPHLQVGQVHAIRHSHEGNMAYPYSLCNAAGNSSPEITFVVMLPSVPTFFLVFEYIS